MHRKKLFQCLVKTLERMERQGVRLLRWIRSGCHSGKLGLDLISDDLSVRHEVFQLGQDT